MTAPRHTFNVDLTNPGQFFACCGLLELANSLDAGTLGWFDGERFHLRAERNTDRFTDLIGSFLQCTARPADGTAARSASPNGAAEDEDCGKSPPLQLSAPFDFRLDWWTDPTALRAGFKTWAGGQTVSGIFDGMRRHVREQSLDEPDLLTRAVSLKKPKPFYFDSRLSTLT